MKKFKNCLLVILKLIERNGHLELSIVDIEALKQEVEYLKNKIVCDEQIEKVLRNKLAENGLKIKSHQNSYALVSAYHDKNQENYKIGIGFDYEDTKDKKNLSHISKTLSKEKGPQILKNVSNTVFKRTSVDFDDELLIIKHKLLDEDNKEECENSSPAVELKGESQY